MKENQQVSIGQDGEVPIPNCKKRVVGQIYPRKKEVQANRCHIPPAGVTIFFAPVANGMVTVSGCEECKYFAFKESPRRV